MNNFIITICITVAWVHNSPDKGGLGFDKDNST